MKKITITCDYCKRDISNDDIICVGSEDEKTFKYSNIKDGREVAMMRNYTDLHFCGQQHFIDFFFKPN